MAGCRSFSPAGWAQRLPPRRPSLPPKGRSVASALLLAATAASVARSQSKGGSRRRGSARSLLSELGLELPEDFFRGTFEHRWSFLPGPSQAKEIFQKIWGLRMVLAYAAAEGFKAFERGIPRPAADPESRGDARAVRAARRALRKNLSLVQNHVHRSHAPLARYMRKASAFFGLPGGMNSYTTPAGTTGFGYHFDPSDAFILQVSGTKTWELCNRRLTDPFGFANLTYNQVPAGDLDVLNCTNVVLSEGDALYLPIGQVHRATASDATSVHLTMSLNRQFCSSAALLLNVAEQINPSKEVGFAQPSFVKWLHRTAADPGFRLAELHDVPPALLCQESAATRGRGARSSAACAASRGFLDERVLGEEVHVSEEDWPPPAPTPLPKA
ncbi:unnamed protein product, partial [Polarella glacialis]